MAPFAEGTVGPVQLNDGAPSEIRLTKDRALVSQDVHGRYFEGTIRGAVYTIASTGISALQGFATTLSTTNNTPLLALANPIGSGKAAVVIRGGATLTALPGLTSPGVGGPGFAWNYAIAQSITAAQGAPPVSNLLSSTGSASVMKGYGINALTGLSTSTIFLRSLGSVGVTTSTAATMAYGPINLLEETAGDIVVPPGTLLAIVPTTTSTTATALASITYEEVTYNYP